MKSEDIERIFILQGSIIDSTSVYAEDYDLANIFKTYTERNGKNIFFASYYQHIWECLVPYLNWRSLY